jgi:hypothetical protein
MNNQGLRQNEVVVEMVSPGPSESEMVRRAASGYKTDYNNQRQFNAGMVRLTAISTDKLADGVIPFSEADIIAFRQEYDPTFKPEYPTSAIYAYKE